MILIVAIVLSRVAARTRIAGVAALKKSWIVWIMIFFARRGKVSLKLIVKCTTRMDRIIVQVA